MTAEQFTYWLQGFLELSDTDSINGNQVEIIKDHLALVFNKETPDRSKKELLTSKLPDGFSALEIKVNKPVQKDKRRILNNNGHGSGTLLC